MLPPAPTRPSVMNHNFSQVPSVNIERSKFNRSHGYKTTFDSGYLVPVFVDEVLPGDTFNLRMNAFARLATPIYPIMDNMYLETFFFFVPNRLIWENWEKFNGAQDNPDDSTDFAVPLMTASAGVANGSLGDYMGLPTGIGDTTFNSLHFRAYNLIFNTWFRDQNLQDSVVVQTDDGPDTYADYVLLRRGKRHDYFTSCLPWPQKGPDVTFAIGVSAPVDLVPPSTSTNPMIIHLDDGSSIPTGAGTVVSSSSGGTANAQLNSNVGGSISGMVIDPNGRLYADLTSATAVTVNQLREAEQMQVLFERDARGGTRYIEIIRSHFGVVSPDARLQRPEFLGGGSSQINVHPVPQTSTSGSSPTPNNVQGGLAAFGTGSFNGHGFNKSFVEHGVIIGLVNVRADLTYQQGLNRMWSRSTRYDYYWPALSHLGEQGVLNQEIYYTTNLDQNAEVFGYQERYAEYRYKPSQITGQFRSNYSTPLDAWHLSQYFGSLPTLGDTFIEDYPPLARCIAYETGPQFIFDSFFNLTCARPMPVYAVPTLGDRL